MQLSTCSKWSCFCFQQILGWMNILLSRLRNRRYTQVDWNFRQHSYFNHSNYFQQQNFVRHMSCMYACRVARRFWRVADIIAIVLIVLILMTMITYFHNSIEQYTYSVCTWAESQRNNATQTTRTSFHTVSRNQEREGICICLRFYESSAQTI